MRMKISIWMVLVVVSAIMARAQDDQQKREHQVMELANQERSDKGLQELAWDDGLAKAAQAHAARMAQEVELSHRYGGEQDLPQRAAAAGAHFNLIEENIAIGHTPLEVHQEWMKSQMHHDNLMNPKIDKIGVGIVAARGVLYTVADYSVSVQTMDARQEEAKIGELLKSKGVTVVDKAAEARKYCALDSGAPEGTAKTEKPGFIMRWQGSDLSRLPDELDSRIASKKYTQAAVGACAPQSDNPNAPPAFSSYRVAVLLY
jgi:hypothetical protein